MDIEEIRNYALQKLDVTESFPFGADTLVFKVNNKMFLLAALDKQPLSLNLKCNPDKALELRDEYPDYILPGFHMNKKHWNTILPHGLKTELLLQMINDSYNLIAPKKSIK